jgi:ribosome-interacting GTPase 1
MPTNLPPDYFEADKRFRQAQTTPEKIALLEEMISIVPKHKGTDHLRADLRRQLSRLKEEAQSRRKHGGHQTSYQVDKEGAGQVAVIGPTNTGKSTLVSALTNAAPETSPAPYTTWKPVPGMMPVENFQVQLIDTPPIDREFVEPALFDLIRHSDLILLVADLQSDPMQQIEETLDQLHEQRIIPPQYTDRYPGESRLLEIPTIILVNKFDDPSLDELFDLCCEALQSDWTILPISAKTGRNFDLLKSVVHRSLGVIRVYARPPGKEPDLERPFVLKRGATVLELAEKIHRDFHEHLKTARVWGSTAFDGQLVQRDYVLQDGDIVELRM